jgi:prepilin peptidase CpaA
MNAALATFANLVTPWALLGLLLAATRVDVLSNRIPNALTATGALLGLALSAAAGGGEALLQSALGGLTGLVAFLPFHALRGMAAGDVKLMAAAGTFFGPAGAGIAAAASLVSGAVLAIAHVLWERWRPLSVAERALAGGTDPRRLDASRARHMRFPYAAAILVGATCALAWTGALTTRLVAGVP